MSRKQPIAPCAALFLAFLISVQAPWAAGSDGGGATLEELDQRATELVTAGDWQGAVSVLEQLVRMRPENVQYQSYLGEAYRRQERHEEAIRAFEAALELDRGRAMALLGMAISLEKTGELDRAFDFFDRGAATGIPPEAFEKNPAFAGLRRHPRFAEALAIAETASNPCLHLEPYDDFDFWVGDWDVYVDEKKVAENLITKEMDGCILRERFHNDQGYRGESLGYFDPETGHWKQNWATRRAGWCATRAVW